MTLRQHQKRLRTYWLVDLGRINGHRARKNFKSKSAARAFLRAKRQERERDGRRALELSQEDRVDFLRARTQLADAGSSISQAVAFFLERRPKSELPIGAALDQCLLSKQSAGCRPRYLDQFEKVIRSFAAGRSEQLVSRVEPREIEAWLNGNGWAAATRRSYRIDLRTFFAWCKSRSFAAENPCDAVPRVLLEDKEPGILSVADCRRLFAAALEKDRGLAPYLAIGLFCGVRPAELDLLSWSNVQARHVVIAGPVAKSRRRRLVSIARNARAWLDLGGDLPVKNLRRRLARVRKAAGIEWPHDCLRHSFASYHLAAHQSQDATAHELGHGSTAMLFAHYRALVTPSAARAFWRITPASLKAEKEKILRLPAAG